MIELKGEKTPNGGNEGNEKRTIHVAPTALRPPFEV